MSWASVVTARLRALFGRTRLDSELDDEVHFHLEMQAEDNLKAGMNPAEARFAAVRSFGGIDQMKEQYRERRAFALVEETAHDVRYAARILIKSPGFTATAVMVLALGIGVNTAIFSVLNATLFRPLPYPSPEQLVMVWRHDPTKNLREGRTAYWTANQWRSHSKSFVDMAFFDGASATLTTTDQADKVSVIRASPSLFPLLGIRPLHGRVFTAEEAEQRQRLAVISHRFWQARFGGSLDAIGASIFLDGAPSRVIGILSADYESDDDVWEPYSAYPDWENVRSARGGGPWTVIGRLRPNVTVEQAQAELNAIALGLDEPLPAAQRPGVSLVPMRLQVVGPRSRMTLWMLAGAVLLVLLIAVTNVASLSLARTASRQREIAIRAALGASRARIVRQLLAENLTLAVTAGLLGLLVAYAGIRLILVVKPGNLARLHEVSLDWHVLGFALALCLLSGALVGLIPAITAARQNLRSSSQQGGRGIAGGAAMVRTRRALVVTEFALAAVLLVGAGLLVRSLLSVQKAALGFRPERVLVVALAPPASTETAQRTGFYRRVLEHVYLHAQREAGEAYIKSQKHLGWTLLANQYDDGGFSGGTLERPALQRLLDDIDTRRVDCVVVYKVDRLSRSLLDFARLVDRFDQRSVSFVSVTQQFNTTSSLGRLTLNILLSFAQFEREIIGERTRDKMSAARRKGKWVGGTPVLGYDVASGGGRLVINEEEAPRVRQIFALYAKHHSLLLVVTELVRRRWTNKAWKSKQGHPTCGKSFYEGVITTIAHQCDLHGESGTPWISLSR